jgi:hypothetical protein
MSRTCCYRLRKSGEFFLRWRNFFADTVFHRFIKNIIVSFNLYILCDSRFVSAYISEKLHSGITS